MCANIRNARTSQISCSEVKKPCLLCSRWSRFDLCKIWIRNHYFFFNNNESSEKNIPPSNHPPNKTCNRDWLLSHVSKLDKQGKKIIRFMLVCNKSHQITRYLLEYHYPKIIPPSKRPLKRWLISLKKNRETTPPGLVCNKTNQTVKSEEHYDFCNTGIPFVTQK